MTIVLILIAGTIYVIYKDIEQRYRNQQPPTQQPQIPWNTVMASTQDIVEKAVNTLDLTAYHIKATKPICLLHVSNHPTPLTFRFPINNEYGISAASHQHFQADLNALLQKFCQQFHDRLSQANLPPDIAAFNYPALFFGVRVINTFDFEGYIYLECELP